MLPKIYLLHLFDLLLNLSSNFRKSITVDYLEIYSPLHSPIQSRIILEHFPNSDDISNTAPTIGPKY